MEREQFRHIQQSIMGEQYYQLARDRNDQAGQEDEMYARLQELVEEAVLSPEEAEECFTDWWNAGQHHSQQIVPDDRVGFDSEGNYHCPSLRTEHLNG